MDTLEVVLGILAYLVVTVVTKSYIKIHRQDRWDREYMSEVPYMLGMFWPIYWPYRLIAWPFSIFSATLEKMMVEQKEKPKEAKLRIEEPQYTTQELLEAEREVELSIQKETDRRYYES